MSLESRVRRLAEAQTQAQGVLPGAIDALTITELYRRVDRAVRESFPGPIWITGEIRQLKVAPRGHCYIDLVDPVQARDSGAATLGVKCWSTRWRSVRNTLEGLGVTLEAGMVVRAQGEVQFYKGRGTVDFILAELDTEALLGRVAAERARLVKALVDEGLFDRQRRLAVTDLPLRVGLVASPRTEGYHDFLGGLEGSGLAFEVTVAPTAVQGRSAHLRVASAIRSLQHRPLDVIVLVRGGGSKADLAAFDQEPVARAIATSDIPVWTGIGHTGDQAVADEVANRSFITPTECGQELASRATEYWRAVIHAGTVLARLGRGRLLEAEGRLASHQRAVATGARVQLDRHGDRLGHRALTLRGMARGQLDTHRHRLSARAGVLALATDRVTRTEGDALLGRCRRLAVLPDRCLSGQELRLGQWRRLLGAYDYQRQLERGYSVTRDASGSVVRSVSGLVPGSELFTQLSDGEVASRVAQPTTAGPPSDASPDEGTGHGSTYDG